MFVVRFNYPVSKAQVESHLYFTSIEGTEKERQEHLYPVKAHSDRTTQEKGKEGKEQKEWFLSAAETLPGNTKIGLKLRAGLKSSVGPESSENSDTLEEIRTFPPFVFLGVRCWNSDSQETFLTPPGKPPEAQCDSLGPVSLQFTSPILPSEIKKHLSVTPPLRTWHEREESFEKDKEEEERLEALQGQPGNNIYEIDLPSPLKGSTSYHIRSTLGLVEEGGKGAKFLHSDPSTAQRSLRDAFGRPLEGPIEVRFTTARRSPNVFAPYNQVVLESQTDSEVPVYVSNVTETNFHHRLLSPVDGVQENKQFRQSVPLVENIQFAVPMHLRKMLGGKSGAVYGYFTSTPPVEPRLYLPGNKYLFAQVTPYNVHVKLGHFNTLVWVTDFATGLPVEGARITIYQGRIENMPEGEKYPPVVADGVTSASGIAILGGREVFDPYLSLHYGDQEKPRLMVGVEKGEDIALLPLTWSFLVRPYEMGGEALYPNPKARFGHIKAWGTTPQGIYRLGDKIQYKIYVRNQDVKTFQPPPLQFYHLKLIDPLGNKIDEKKDIRLNEFGSYADVFNIPEQGAMGWYQFELAAYDTQGEAPGENSAYEWSPMRVLVSDFTPAPFKVQNEIHGKILQAGQEVEVTTSATFHSGGPYAEGKVRVTAVVESKVFAPEKLAAQGFDFGKIAQRWWEPFEHEQNVFYRTAKLNKEGVLVTHFTLPQLEGPPRKRAEETSEENEPQKIDYGKLFFESAVEDDRGKRVTAGAYADYMRVDRFVGLKKHAWVAKAGESLRISYVVTDGAGEMVSGVPVPIILERQKTHALHVKSAGNAYLKEGVRQWVAQETCSGRSQADIQECIFTPKEPGFYRLSARIKDTQGQTQETQIFLYVEGTGYVLWDQENQYALEILPEKATYKVGQKARYFVKNPYPGAQALVSIERYGIMDHFVQPLKESTAVIEFEVKPEYVPGFYLSVQVFSGRVPEPKKEGEPSPLPTASTIPAKLPEDAEGVDRQIDLGKPTFRMAYVKVPVEDSYKSLTVQAQTLKAEYKPGEEVEIDIQARFPEPSEAPSPVEPSPNRATDSGNLAPSPMVRALEPIEFAVAVLDAGVFDLIQGGRKYFDPKSGLWHLDDLDVENYSLLTALIGRQKFQQKGAAAAGDGGADLSLRNNFKFLAYWNPSILANKEGRAQIKFKVPDNLTGWKILVLAATRSDKMGLGEGSFKVNQPTEIRPILPNYVTENDRFSAGFTIMNRTDQKRNMNVRLQAAGPIDSNYHAPLLETEVILDPYQRTNVFLPLQVLSSETDKPSSESGEEEAIRFEVRVKDQVGEDGLEHKLPVVRRHSLETMADYGTSGEGTITQSIQVPQDIRTDIGEISLTLAPSILGQLEESLQFMRDYPYNCWEQRISKALAAAFYQELRPYLKQAFSWIESAHLPNETLNMAQSFQAPNGGMAYFMPRDEFSDPYLTAYTGLAFVWLKRSGYTIPEPVETRLQDYLKRFLKNDGGGEAYTGSVKASVQALALAVLAQNNALEPEILERYQPRLPQMDLFGKTHFLEAVSAVNNKNTSLQKKIINQLLSEASVAGQKFFFEIPKKNEPNVHLSSPFRDNCAILSTLSKLKDQTAIQGQISDIPPKLMPFVVQRPEGKSRRWQGTQENVFCLKGVLDYAKAYEKVVPRLEVTVNIDKRTIGKTHFSTLQDPSVIYYQPLTQEDVGKKKTLTVNRKGQGRLYYTAQIRYAPRLPMTSVNAGLEVKREYSVAREGAEGPGGIQWELLKPPFQIRQSDLIRVDIFLSLPVSHDFVVVDDPVPAGLEPVNRQLATASKMDSGAFPPAPGSWWYKQTDWQGETESGAGFYHQELGHRYARFYSEYLAPGHYHLSYTAQAIVPGTFTLLPLHAEEMYAPDVYGKDGGGILTVAPLQ